MMRCLAVPPSSVRLMNSVRHMLRRLWMLSSPSVFVAASNTRACCAAQLVLWSRLCACVFVVCEANKALERAAFHELCAAFLVVVRKVHKHLHELQQKLRRLGRAARAPRRGNKQCLRKKAVPARALCHHELVLFAQVCCLLNDLEQRADLVVPLLC